MIYFVTLATLCLVSAVAAVVFHFREIYKGRGRRGTGTISKPLDYLPPRDLPREVSEHDTIRALKVDQVDQDQEYRAKVIRLRDRMLAAKKKR